MNDELVRADPVVRRRALAILLGAGVAGAAAIQWGVPWLELARLRQPGMQRTICITFLGVIVVLALAVIGSGRRVGDTSSSVGRSFSWRSCCSASEAMRWWSSGLDNEVLRSDALSPSEGMFEGIEPGNLTPRRSR